MPASIFGSGGGGGGQVSEAQVWKEAQYKRRMDLLLREVPQLAQSKLTDIHALASSEMDIDDMMTAALDAVGTIEVQNMVSTLNDLPADQQQAAWQTMDPTKRSTLESAGWVPKQQDDDDSLWDRAKGIGAAIAGGGMRAVNFVTTLPVIKQGLAAMTWAAEEVTRTQRVNPIQDSMRRALDESGMSEEQLMSRTGIDTRFASSSGSNALETLAKTYGGPLAGIVHDGNLDWFRTWNAIGHKGSDDFLADVQYRVFGDLEDEYSTNAKDVLRYAKAVAGGMSLEDLAEQEGRVGPDAEMFMQQISSLTTHDAFKKAVQDLEGGRVSFGRTVARALWMDPSKNVSAGGASSWISGSADAVFAIVADPTLIGGKISKSVRATKWALSAGEGLDDLARWQKLNKVNKLLLDGATDDVIDAALKDITGRGWRQKAHVGRRQALLAEAQAVGRPAELVAEAFRTGDFDTLRRQLPTFTRSVADMRKFHAHRQAVGGADLTDSDAVFDFYKWAAGDRSVINGIEDVAMMDVKSTKLFGHDGSGLLYVPHITRTKRAALMAKESIRDWFDGDPIPAELKQVADEAAAELTDSVGKLDNGLSAAADDAVDAGNFDIAAAADEMEIDEDTLAYVVKKTPEVKQEIRKMAERGWVRTQAQRFYRTVTTPTTADDLVPLTDDAADGADMFNAFNQSLGLLAGESAETIGQRYNTFVNGNAAQRLALVNQMVIDMASASGMGGTRQADEVIRKYIEKNNHIFGFHDAITRQSGDMTYIVRQAILEEQLADFVQIPSFKEMLIATRRSNKLRWVAGGLRNSELEALFNRVWRPGMLMKFGFPLRAGADEALAHIGRTGARGYFNRTVLLKWAGVRDAHNNLARSLTGEVLAAPKAAVAPTRWMTGFMAHWFNVTDDALKKKGELLAMQNPRWQSMDQLERAAEVATAQQQVQKGLRLLPKSVKWVDDGAHRMAVNMSAAWHSTALGKKMSRAEFARRLLEIQGADDYARMMQYSRDMMMDPAVQIAHQTVAGHVLAGIMPESQIDQLRAPTRFLRDPRSPTGYQAVRVRRDMDEFRWIGDEDLTGKYTNAAVWMNHMAKSPSGRAYLRERMHQVDQGVLDEIVAAYGDDLADQAGEAIEVLRAVRQQLRSRNLNVYAEWKREDIVDFLKNEKIGGPGPLNASDAAELADLEKLLGRWNTLSPEARDLLTDPHLVDWKLTTDANVVRNRGALAAYNEMSKLDNASTLRSMIRTSQYDGKPVMVLPPEGHTALYAPMIDRRVLPDLLRVFDVQTSDELARQFAESLKLKLSGAGLGGELNAVWSAAVPGDLASWAASLKASIAQGGEGYITAVMTGSSNYRVAEAVRDSLAELLPPGMLKPTVGYYHVPDELIGSKVFGLEKRSEAVVGMQPDHALKFTPIDPNNVVRQLEVQLPDGTRMWLGENEINQVAGNAARFNRVDKKKRAGITGMTRRNSDGVMFNPKLIEQDFDNGMAFLRGTGGHFSKTSRVSRYEWADPEEADVANMLDEIFVALDIDDNFGMDVSDAVAWLRSRKITEDLPFRNVLEDAGFYDEFVELSKSAKRTRVDGTPRLFVDEPTVAESKIVKQALDELGVDIDELGLTKEQYQALLVAREQAHFVLNPVGGRPSRTASKEAVEREKDALAIAFQHSGLYPGTASDQISSRIQLAMKDQPADYTILSEVWGNGVTQDVALRSTAQQVSSEVDRLYSSEQSGQFLRDAAKAALNGELTPSELMRVTELRDLPQKVLGPVEVLAPNNAWDRLVNNHFNQVETTIAAISRHPMYGQAFARSMDGTQFVYNAHVHKGLAEQAGEIISRNGLDADDLNDLNKYVVPQFKDSKEWVPEPDDLPSRYAFAVHNGDHAEASKLLSKITGKDIALTADEVDVMRRWQLNQSVAHAAHREKAAMRAQEMVVPYVDDHRLRSALQEYIGPLFMPYFYAEEQFLKRWVRSIYETPHILRKGQLTMNGLRSIGILDRDEYGNEVLVLPGSELATSVMAEVAVAITGNEAYSVLAQPLEMRTEYMVPGYTAEQSRFSAGPLLGLVTNEITTRFPATEWRKEDPSRPQWEYVVPAPVVPAIRMFLQDKKEVSSTQMNAAQFLYATGHGLKPDATTAEKEDFLTDVRQVTYVMGALKMLTGFVGPTKATFQEPAGMMRKEFTDLLADGLSYDEALAEFLELYGPDAIAYTIFGTANEVGAPIPNTTGARDFMLEYGEMIRSDPETMVWLIPQDGSTSEFDRRAYNEALSLGLRSKREPQELLDAIQIKQASGKYFDMRDEYEASRRAIIGQKSAGWEQARDELDAQWKAKSQVYLNQHPTFKASFGPEASNRRQKVLQNLEYRLAAGIGGEQGQLLRPLVDSFHEFQREFRSIQGSSKAARRIKQGLFEDYFAEQWLYVRSNPRAKVFWDSVIRPELPDSMEDVKLGSMGGQTARQLMEA